MKRSLRTCTTMIFTDGTTSRYAVMRGPMRGKMFNAAKADILATYERAAFQGNSFSARLADMEQFERETTARHATADAPAVFWQA